MHKGHLALWTLQRLSRYMLAILGTNRDRYKNIFNCKQYHDPYALPSHLTLPNQPVSLYHLLYRTAKQNNNNFDLLNKYTGTELSHTDHDCDYDSESNTKSFIKWKMFTLSSTAFSMSKMLISAMSTITLHTHPYTHAQFPPSFPFSLPFRTLQRHALYIRVLISHTPQTLIVSFACHAIYLIYQTTV